MSDSPITVELRGLTDVRAAFRDFKEYLPKTPLRNAVRKAAQSMAQLVALVAPRATGNLAKNIVAKTKYTLTTVRGRVAVNTLGKARGPQNAFYWRFLEKGFRTPSGQARRFPFVEGVFRAKGAAAAQEVVDAVDQTIKRAERRARRAWGQS
jgi:HK97 gp10 family phage protein